LSQSDRAQRTDTAAVMIGRLPGTRHALRSPTCGSRSTPSPLRSSD